eukprot:4877933-Heterocapsa_arctica.AAC.1
MALEDETEVRAEVRRVRCYATDRRGLGPNRARAGAEVRGAVSRKGRRARPADHVRPALLSTCARLAVC